MEKRTAFYIFGWCGLASLLVDFDHIISLLLWRYVNPTITEGRIWHTPLFILSCLVICYLGTHLRGLYFKLVLIVVVMLTILVLVFSPEVVWGI